MYLVHARLRAPLGVPLPPETRSLVRSGVREEDGIEHVAVHPHASPHPVIGLYVRVESLAAAEARAARVCRRVLRECAEFTGWSLVVADAPLVAPFYESLLSASGPAQPPVDPLGQGRFGPAEGPSHCSDQRRE
ncbi:hypothetical protein ACIRP0_34505 [Streptomyces sp. NPDC101733]|uniref:hypothetical protein n=1 Tax=unclassified Streptomyces TaxID=2593676 RepID=UPI00380F9510